MGTITLHGLDDDLDRKLRQTAKKEGRSINKTAKDLLRKCLGMTAASVDHRGDFIDLFGSWTGADVAEFEEATGDLREVEPKDWR